MSRAQNAHETRCRIMDAARAQFMAHGYGTPTIRSIADQADVAVGTVMLHFKDKHGLLAATLEEQIEAALMEMSALRVAADKPCCHRLAALVAPLYAQYFAHPPLARALIAGGLFIEGEWAERQNAQLIRFRVLAAAHAQIPLEDVRLDAFMAAYLLVLVGALRTDFPDLAGALHALERVISTIEGFA